MRSFTRPDTFDLAICLYTSFGFFEDDADNRLVLQRVHENLRPGGRFVLDVMGKETLARIYQPTGSTKIPGVGTTFTRRTFIESYSRLENEWTLVMEDGQVRTFTFRHWVYSARELELMMRDAGFTTVETFGDFEGHPYDPSASRLVVVATR
jgi:SAM-dependent methyltransferase